MIVKIVNKSIPYFYIGSENQGERPKYVLDGEKHQELYTENFAMQRFGAFWMNYLYTMEHTESISKCCIFSRPLPIPFMQRSWGFLDELYLYQG